MNFFHLLLLLLALSETGEARIEIEYEGNIFCNQPNFKYKLQLIEYDVYSSETLYEDPDFVVVRNCSHHYRAVASCEDDGPEDNVFEFVIAIDHDCTPGREEGYLVLNYQKIAVKYNKVFIMQDIFLHREGDNAEGPASVTIVNEANILMCPV